MLSSTFLKFLAATCNDFKLDTVLQGVETDARAHSGSDGSALEVSALCSGGLCLCNGAHDGIQVAVQLLCTEGSLAHGDMDDVLLVQTVLDLTSLGLRNCLAQIGSDSCLLYTSDAADE